MPAFNDGIAGRPGYLATIADVVAEKTAAKTDGEYPVLVAQDEGQGCVSKGESPAPDYADILYLYTYSERSRSLCLTLYAYTPGQRQSAHDRTISASTGQNYGRPLVGSVRAVPIGSDVIVFTPAFLSLLHWRTRLDAGDTRVAAKTERHFSDPTITFGDLNLNLLELRARVGQRRAFENRVLLVLLCVFSGLASAALGWLYLMYAGINRQFSEVTDSVPSLKAYLLEDLAVLATRAERDFHLRQMEAQKQTRAESLLRHTREDLTRRLQFLLSVLPDDEARSQIHACLAADDAEQMADVLRQFQDRIGTKTSDERLGLLLESLKPYCTEEGFADYRSRAFDLLKESGFRLARDFVVKAHDHARARARELEQNTAVEDVEDVP